MTNGQNDSQSKDIVVHIVGSSDITRRLAGAMRVAKDLPFYNRIQITTVQPAEARAAIFSERPNVLLLEVGLHGADRESAWRRAFLEQVRERLPETYTILLVTSPEKMVFAGDLFFTSDDSLDPSGLIDNLIIAPPPGVPSVMSLENQTFDAVDYAIEEIDRRDSGKAPLPALWANGWVPVMCDPESRNVWMRWLPRYALYINENPIIVGPTGAGKTRLAAAIHGLSGREGPFISITPRDFSSTELVQAELFGSVAGAYTGAVDKWGLVKKAERGTLFIDELQSIDHDLQGKLITFIENKSYRRVGEADSHQADVRFIFATNRSLQDLVSDGSLRDDFAYRLERLQISLPALHNRRLDIAAGICFALGRILRERNRNRPEGDKGSEGSPASLEGLTMDAYRSLFGATWPGNLRQLENTVAKLIELADIRGLRLIDSECTGGTIGSLLGYKEASASDIYERAGVDIALQATTGGFSSLRECIDTLTSSAREQALESSGGDPEEAAAILNDSLQAMRLFLTRRG